MKGERLVLVTDFATLRAGMIVVYRPCANCARPHRAMLMTFATGWTTRGEPQPSFKMEPQPTCAAVDDALAIGPITIARRKIFKVIDGLENDQTTTTTKKPEAVK